MAPTNPTPVSSPLRLLILSPVPLPPNPPPSCLPALLEALTGTTPPPDQTNFAGYTTHPPLRLTTKYYSAGVSIWCDEVPSLVSDLELKARKERGEPDAPTLGTWFEGMMGPEAAEVRAAIGGIVLAVPIKRDEAHGELWEEHVEILTTVGELREKIEEEGGGRDVPAVVVMQGVGGKGKMTAVELEKVVENVQRTLVEERGLLGWDFVGWDGNVAGAKEEGKGKEDDEKNEFGEKTGIARVIEVLEAVDWSAPTADSEEALELGFLGTASDEEFASGVDGIKLQAHELEREMMGLKVAMREEEVEGHGTGVADEDEQVDGLPALMERVVAIREASAEMGEQERKQFAMREVSKIMREMK